MVDGRKDLLAQEANSLLRDFAFLLQVQLQTIDQVAPRVPERNEIITIIYRLRITYGHDAIKYMTKINNSSGLVIIILEIEIKTSAK